MGKMAISGMAGSAKPAVKVRGTYYRKQLIRSLNKRFDDSFFLQFCGDNNIRTKFGDVEIDDNHKLADAMIENNVRCGERLLTIYRNAIMTGVEKMPSQPSYELFVDLEKLSAAHLRSIKMTIKQAWNCLRDEQEDNNIAYAFLRKCGAIDREYRNPFGNNSPRTSMRVTDHCERLFSGQISYFNRSNLNMLLTFKNEVVSDIDDLGKKVYASRASSNGMTYELFAKAMSTVITVASKNRGFSFTLELSKLLPDELPFSANDERHIVYDFLDRGYSERSVKFLQNIDALQMTDNDPKNLPLLFV
jgi:hypothetical protein